MDGHHSGRDSRGPVLAAVFTLALLALVSAALLAPAAFAAGAARQSVLTLRTVGSADEVWLVATDGTAGKAGVLPGLAGASASSPDGDAVAYVPQRGAAVWVWQRSGGVKVISMTAVGVTGVNGLTWIAADKVLVSGSKGKGLYDPYSARLYTVDVTTGGVRAFRNVSGGQPSADVASGKVVYVRFQKLDNGSAANDHTPLIRESLMKLDLGTTAAPEVLTSRKYRDYYETAFFAGPRIAPGGDWCISGAIPDDPEVTYTVRDTSLPWFSLFQTGAYAAAWAPTGLKVAFCGSVDSSVEGSPDACIFVLEPAAGSLVRSAVVAPAVQDTDVWADGVAWALDGSLVVDSITLSEGPVVETVHLVGSDLRTVKDLGPGHLSAWVQ
jgi:hypothetical protein